MTLPSGWCELHRSRFSAVPEDCGDAINPGVLVEPDCRDWSRRNTTRDQRRIERYIGSFDLRDARLLHIGIGNSGLAKRFHARVKEIVGTTVEPREIGHSREAAIPNYRPTLQNKYAALPQLTPGEFDFIIDNNPASYCCCMAHLVALFGFYAAKLASGGQIVTDRQGLAWVPPAGNPHLRLDFDDLNSIASVAGFSLWQFDQTLYVLTRGEPPAKPSLVGQVRSRIRSAASHSTEIQAKAAGRLLRSYRALNRT